MLALTRFFDSDALCTASPYTYMANLPHEYVLLNILLIVHILSSPSDNLGAPNRLVTTSNLGRKSLLKDRRNIKQFPLLGWYRTRSYLSSSSTVSSSYVMGGNVHYRCSDSGVNDAGVDATSSGVISAVVPSGPTSDSSPSDTLQTAQAISNTPSSPSADNRTTGSQNRSTKVIIPVCVVVGVIIVISGVLTCWWWSRCRRKPAEGGRSTKTKGVQPFSIEESGVSEDSRPQGNLVEPVGEDVLTPPAPRFMTNSNTPSRPSSPASAMTQSPREKTRLLARNNRSNTPIAGEDSTEAAQTPERNEATTGVPRLEHQMRLLMQKFEALETAIGSIAPGSAPGTGQDLVDVTPESEDRPPDYVSQLDLRNALEQRRISEESGEESRSQGRR
ncbi:hypothetical protein NP233_g4238 [Leucocoprinus birnbaumii]|uniref:Uncharacterized protein n=1 Tax=Leucocoprinus birnbaumii TaxID=56174 RepID=A0AAD5VVF3_9AGAR|nr:hypothetical protein NP233_g4238 [Leucocoprinus birnbaumii]